MEIFGTQGFWGPAYKVIFAQVIEDSQVIEDMRTLQFLGKKKKNRQIEGVKLLYG